MSDTTTTDKLLIQPKIRGFICTTAHPEGCQQHTRQWIDYVNQQALLESQPKNVLVIGASTGFGLASRITAAFAGNAKTIGVFFEKPASGKRTASAGWYNTAAFEQEAHKKGLYAKSINGDAFSDTIKQQVIELVKKDWPEKIDCVVYSIASPRRQHPKTGVVFSSVLKPIGQSYQNKTVDVMKQEVTTVDIEPANEQEIDETIAVMGGEDWQLWIECLLKENLLATGCKTIAYTYIGPELTHPIYRDGTIGQAKAHLHETAKQLDTKLKATCSGEALISVNKALVTQASAAIPVVPLYISLLFRIMKQKDIHEGCIEQMYRLFHDHLYSDTRKTDSSGYIRVDDWEMRETVQQQIKTLWQKVNTDNLSQVSDIIGYLHAFHQLFGFKVDGVDYQQPVSIDVKIPSLS